MFPRAPPAFPLPISIHAPTRGATVLLVQLLIHHLFQSTLPREERLILRRFLYQLKNFNPRSHERSDLTSFVKYFSLRNFNPRSHERSDAIPTIPTSKKLLFQSTLPREERQNFLLLLKFGIRYFNPRSHERSDLAHKSFPSHQVFQSTLPREERLNAVYFFHTLQIFQSTLPREERHKTISSIIESKYFNPRSHERSDAR